ncbi:MAG: hypothetical protein AAF414_21365 [Pseudomonadota bacterium]
MNDVSDFATGGDGPWAFSFRAIETNAPMHWEGPWLDRVLAMMRQRGFNALATHQNDLLDELSHLDSGGHEGVGDLRRKMVYSRASWMRRLARRLGEQGAGLYLEVKEPSYADYLLDLYPDLVDANGAVNPLNSQWPSILKRKVEAVLSAIPDLAGIIVSFSSPESRASPHRYLRKEQEREFDFASWLRSMIDAIAEPLEMAGKRLIVRDFSYGRQEQLETLNVLKSSDRRLAAALKITPLDYFPGFPNNPAIRAMGDVPVIVEFEAVGEDTGWGLVPNCRAAEFVDRMNYVQSAGAAGIMIRINWEGIIGWSALDSLSDSNIFALARLMVKGAAQDPETLVCAWIEERYGLAADSPLARELASALVKSLGCIREIYWFGNVFPRHSQIPLTWQQAWWSMQHHALSHWYMDGSHDRDFELTEANRHLLFKAKADAVALAENVALEVQQLLNSDSVPDALRADMGPSFARMPAYLQAFDLAMRGAFLAKRYDRDHGQEDRDAVLSIAAEMEALAGVYAAISEADKGGAEAHVVDVMFDHAHLRSFARSLREL